MSIIQQVVGVALGFSLIVAMAPNLGTLDVALLVIIVVAWALGPFMGS